MKKHQKRAFTLLELLVVIAIIGILISLGVASFSNAQRKSRDSRRREDLKSVQNGLEQYYADNNGSYPSEATMDDVVNAAGTDYFPAGAPTDPKVGQFYTMDSPGDTYCACAWLETPGAGNAINSSCSFTGAGSKDYFCVINLQ